MLVHFGVDYEYVETPTGRTLLAYWDEEHDEYSSGRCVVCGWAEPHPQVESVEEWIGGRLGAAGINDYIPEPDFHAEFWREAGEATRLYHVTTEERRESILVAGLEARNETRGMSNHYTGAAVFTSRERDDTGVYGDVVIEIDFSAMKRDGFMPQAAMEYPVVTENQQASLAWLLSIEDWEREASYDGLYEDTVALFADIPARYLRVVTQP